MTANVQNIKISNQITFSLFPTTKHRTVLFCLTHYEEHNVYYYYYYLYYNSS